MHTAVHAQTGRPNRTPLHICLPTLAWLLDARPQLCVEFDAQQKYNISELSRPTNRRSSSGNMHFNTQKHGLLVSGPFGGKPKHRAWLLTTVRHNQSPKACKD